MVRHVPPPSSVISRLLIGVALLIGLLAGQVPTVAQALNSPRPPLKPDAINLALGKTATASSYYANDPTYGPANANDDSYSTWWASYNAADSNPWIEIDLAQVYSVNQVKFRWDVGAASFALEGSNDHSGWTTIQSGSAGSGQSFDWAVTATYRYLRLHGFSVGAYMGIVEFEIYGSLAASNLALGKTASASSYFNNLPTYSPAKVNDDSYSTYWASNVGDPDIWVKIDLGQAYSLGRVKFKWELGAATYAVEGSNNDASWTTLRSGTNAATGQIDEWGLSGTYRYVRLHGTQPTFGYFSIYEFEIYGPCMAQTTGNWNNSATWACGAVPTTSVNVVIPNGVAVTLDTNTADLGSVTIDSGGTLVGSGYTLALTGNWTNNGTFTAGTGTVIFDGSGTQTLTGNTTFNNLTINSGAILDLGTSGAITVNGTQTNNGDLRQSRAVGAPGVQNFGATGLTIDVQTQGTLSSLQVDRIDQPHPNRNANGGGAFMLNRYFTITPGGADYTTEVCAAYTDAEVSTLNEANLRLCRWTGSAWVCPVRGLNSAPATNVVCAAGVTAFSDWVLGTVGPMAVTVNSLSASAQPSGPGNLAGFALIGLLALGLGGLWITRRVFNFK